MTESADLLLGRYRLLDRLGRGGMGSIWRGQDEYLRRPVAIKVIHLPEELDEDEPSRAIRPRRTEARAAARLRHPGVVSVFDVVVQAASRSGLVGVASPRLGSYPHEHASEADDTGGELLVPDLSAEVRI